MYSFERNSRVYLKNSDKQGEQQDESKQKTGAVVSRVQSSDCNVEVGSVKAPGETSSKAQIARAFAESQELFKAADGESGLKTVKTRRVLKKTTTISRTDDDDVDIAKPLKDMEDELSRLEKINEATEKFNLLLDKIRRKLDELEHILNSMAPIGKTLPVLKKQLDEMKHFMDEMNEVKKDIDGAAILCEQLIRDELAADPQKMRLAIKDLQDQWKRLHDRALKRIKGIEDAMRGRQDYDKLESEFKQSAQDTLDWLDNALAILASDANNYGDVDTVQVLIVQHKAFEEVVASVRPAIDDIAKREKQLLASEYVDEKLIKSIAASVASKAVELNAAMVKKTGELNDALKCAKNLESLQQSILEWLASGEKLALSASLLSYEPEVGKSLLAKLESFEREMNVKSKNGGDKEKADELSKQILKKCHPDAHVVIKYWNEILTERWKQLLSLIKRRKELQAQHVQLIESALINANELIKYLNKQESKLLAGKASRLPTNTSIPQLRSLLAECSNITDELQLHEPELHQIISAFSSIKQNDDIDKKSTQTGRSILLNSSLKENDKSKVNCFAWYADKYPSLGHPIGRLVLNKWRSVWQLSVESVQRVQEAIEKNQLAEIRARNSESSKQKQTNSLTKELDRLLNGKVRNYYHVGGNKFRFGDAQALRKLRLSDKSDSIEVNCNNRWIPFNEFARTKLKA